jgi:hypothetical protein
MASGDKTESKLDEKILELIDLNLSKTNKYNTLRIILGKRKHEHLFETFILSDDDMKIKIEKIKEKIPEERIKTNSLKLKRFNIWNRINILKTYLKPISDEFGREKFINYYSYKPYIHEKEITDNLYVVVEEQTDTTLIPISYSSKDKIGYIECNVLELVCSGEYSGIIILLSNFEGKNSIEIEINRPIDNEKLIDFLNNLL